MPSKVCHAVVFATISLSAPNIALAETAPGPKVTDPHFHLTPGYLQTSDLPDSLVLLGAPPAKGSAALARDEAAREATIPLRGKARWNLARTDADLQFPQPAKNFSCAMGVDISEEKTPHIYRLMERVLTDAGLSTYGVKNKYNRTRPFVVHNEGTCQPDEEDVLRHDGSYPSGHTAAGWAWALTLAEVNPKRTDELLKRGLSFGQSRVICNAHWQSDVDAGRIMAAATVARLHSNPEFLADIQGRGKSWRQRVLRFKTALPKAKCFQSQNTKIFSQMNDLIVHSGGNEDVSLPAIRFFTGCNFGSAICGCCCGYYGSTGHG